MRWLLCDNMNYNFVVDASGEVWFLDLLHRLRSVESDPGRSGTGYPRSVCHKVPLRIAQQQTYCWPPAGANRHG